MAGLFLFGLLDVVVELLPHAGLAVGFLGLNVAVETSLVAISITIFPFVFHQEIELFMQR